MEQYLGTLIKTAVRVVATLVVIGVVGVLILPGIARWPGPETVARSKVSRARADHRSLATIIVEDVRAGRPAPESGASLRQALERPDRTVYTTDPFAENKGEFRWLRDGKYGLLTSRGPDEKVDIVAPQFTAGTMEETTIRLSPLTYDPTNGSISSGDVWHWVELAP